MTRKAKHVLVGTVCLAAVLSTIRCDLSPRVDSSYKGTGTLRVLVTDKPFPFAQVEEALVTITRVEVRRAELEEVCAEDADCDDGVFCDGPEICVDGDCSAGVVPCAADQVCDEERHACDPPCTSDAPCDDGAYCNGVETCNATTGGCVPGPDPCLDNEVCDEDADACVPPATDDDGDDDHDDDGGNPFVVIFQGEKEFNLLDLQNGRTDLLAEAQVPAGTYTLMRLIVTEGTIKLFDVEEPFVLRVPSGAQTGIKLHFTFEVPEGEETTLLLDVDLSRAFKPVPGGHIDDPSTIRTFHFTPSVAMRLINLLDAGRISGFVTEQVGDVLEAVQNVAVTAFDDGGDDVTTTGTDENGSYVLSGLHTGEYRVEFVKDGYQEVTRDHVMVTAGQTTSVDVTLERSSN